jgi:hypothetical protein
MSRNWFVLLNLRRQEPRTKVDEISADIHCGA